MQARSGNELGFTILELMISLMVLGIVIVLIILTSTKSDVSNRPCEYFRNDALSAVPARCVEYFQGE